MCVEISLQKYRINSKCAMNVPIKFEEEEEVAEAEKKLWLDITKNIIPVFILISCYYYAQQTIKPNGSKVYVVVSSFPLTVYKTNY